MAARFARPTATRRAWQSPAICSNPRISPGLSAAKWRSRRSGFRNSSARDVDRQVKRDRGDPGPASESLIESRRVAGLAQQQPDGRHRGRTGAEVQAQFDLGPVGPLADLGQFGIGNPENRDVVGKSRGQGAGRGEPDVVSELAGSPRAGLSAEKPPWPASRCGRSIGEAGVCLAWQRAGSRVQGAEQT